MARNIIQHTSRINGRLKQPIVDPLVQINRDDLVDAFIVDNVRFKSLQLRSGTCEIFTNVNYYGRHSCKPASTIVAIDDTIIDVVEDVVDEVE
jgi:hypothetical protein